jgi:lipopolysaccharide export LptBFGC system permease protein LptF
MVKLMLVGVAALAFLFWALLELFGSLGWDEPLDFTPREKP